MGLDTLWLKREMGNLLMCIIWLEIGLGALWMQRNMGNFWVKIII